MISYSAREFVTGFPDYGDPMVIAAIQIFMITIFSTNLSTHPQHFLFLSL
jgi:hypothetical protein